MNMNYRKPALFLVVFLCLAALPALSKVWHVNLSSTSPIQNGYYWATPLKSLKIAIDSSKAGDTIKVAAGTYIPGTGMESSFLF